jgi:hypothetical protein
MLSVTKYKEGAGLEVQGDFFHIDRLYFALLKFVGDFGLGEKCAYDGYDIACENLLGLCYELRKMMEGERDVTIGFNGIGLYWSDDFIDCSEEADFEDDSKENGQSDQSDQGESQSEDYVEIEIAESYDEIGQAVLKTIDANDVELPDANVYFKNIISFPEAVFYMLILSELLKRTNDFYEHIHDILIGDHETAWVSKIYDKFGAKIDVARITEFTFAVQSALYQFIGEESYNRILDAINDHPDIFKDNDLAIQNDLMSKYAMKKRDDDTPEELTQVILSFLHN